MIEQGARERKLTKNPKARRSMFPVTQMPTQLSSDSEDSMDINKACGLVSSDSDNGLTMFDANTKVDVFFV